MFRQYILFADWVAVPHRQTIEINFECIRCGHGKQSRLWAQKILSDQAKHS